ncbi:MAG: hypothetical protein ACLTLQ_06405 [[Clostridium] scindens]
MPVIDLSNMEIQIEAVQKIPRPLAEKYEMLALHEKDGSLTVALNDPVNFYGIEDIRQLTGMQLEMCLCGREELLKAINYYYSSGGEAGGPQEPTEGLENSGDRRSGDGRRGR